jgi:hypothetical protein
MKLQKLGENILEAEVLNISRHGIWLYVKGKEYFLPYKEYPWFKEAKVSEIYNLELVHGFHLHWPDLDVDLELESLENPEKYPLVYESKP